MANALSSSPEGSPAAAIKRRRGEILGWLRDDAEPLAAIFETITEMVDRLPFPAAGRFICHGAREIGNRLSGYVAGNAISGRTEYPQLVSGIHKAWVATGLPVGRGAFPTDLGANASPGDDAVKIPATVARMVAGLLGEHEASDQRQSTRAELLLHTLNRDAGGMLGTASLTVS